MSTAVRKIDFDDPEQLSRKYRKEIEQIKSSDKLKVWGVRTSFFVDLTTKFLKDQPEVELSGLGIAVTTAVNVVQILKSQGIAEIKSLKTNLVFVRDRVQKPKIEVVLVKSQNFEEIYNRKQTLTAENAEIEELLLKGQEMIQQKLSDTPK
eukprot:TRINITY_DN2032_c0_g2_i2.p1 TRINITY_DN2032_c0_g2~~TRINITY_DN2032_c0_g2_i2.p1  ORF type:complete len:171 (+),score=40.44 TRINITY_DN2032_c0_g2_i2:63-515(+)